MTQGRPFFLLTLLPLLSVGLAILPACQGDAEDPAPDPLESTTRNEGQDETTEEPAEKTNPSEHLVRVTATRATQDRGDGVLMLYGFEREQLDDRGWPSPKGEPVFYWYDPEETGGWPREVRVKMPDSTGLWIFAALDLDSNGRLGPGEHLSKPLPLSAAVQKDGAIELYIEGGLREGKGQGERNPGRTQNGVRKKAGESQEGALGDDKGLPQVTERPKGQRDDKDEVVVLQIKASRDVKSSGPATPLVYAYEPRQLNTMFFPKQGEAPRYFWAGKSGELRWPLRLSLPLPENPGLLILAGLDMDDDGRLSKGDYVSKPVPRDEILAQPLRIDMRMEKPKGVVDDPNAR